MKKPKLINSSKQFSHLFNAYSQAFNKRYRRTGSLFEKPFERKLIRSENYFKQLIFYIHNNPVHHGFVERIADYPWSSYNTILSRKPTKLQRDEIILYFDTIENFVYYHNGKPDLNDIKDILID